MTIIDISTASRGGGCLLNAGEIIPCDLNAAGTDLRTASELLGKLDDAGDLRDRCLCHHGIHGSDQLSPLDLLLVPFCDVILVFGSQEATLYPPALLNRLRAAVMVEV